MKELVLLLPNLALLVFAQTAGSPAGARAELTAKHLTHAGSTLEGSGGVEAKAGGYVIRGDEGTVNPQTGEIEVRGHAYVILPARPDHTVIRHDGTALISDKAVSIQADRIHLEGMSLRASGHVQVRSYEDWLRADEVEIFLKTAEGWAHGSVQYLGPHRGTRDFPPDIVK